MGNSPERLFWGARGARGCPATRGLRPASCCRTSRAHARTVGRSAPPGADKVPDSPLCSARRRRRPPADERQRQGRARWGPRCHPKARCRAPQRGRRGRAPTRAPPAPPPCAGPKMQRLLRDVEASSKLSLLAPVSWARTKPKHALHARIHAVARTTTPNLTHRPHRLALRRPLRQEPRPGREAGACRPQPRGAGGPERSVHQGAAAGCTGEGQAWP